ncbi:GGDEF domain-containing protein [Gordonia sp. NPDC003425]
MADSIREPDRLVDDRLALSVAMAAVLFLAVGSGQLAFDTTPGSKIPSEFAAATSLLLGAFAFLLWRRPSCVTTRNAPILVALTSIVIAANPLVYVVCTRIAFPAIGLLLVIVAIGALVPYAWIAVSLILVLNIIAIGCALIYPQSASVGSVALQLLKADSVALIIALTWRRTERRLREANATIRQMAETDDLTGLLTRRGLAERGPLLVEDAVTTNKCVLVGFLDVDGLKQMNDSLGHAYGDRVLAEVGATLRWLLDEGYLAARIGGDEFAVVISVPHSSLVPVFEAWVEHGLESTGQSVTAGWVHGDASAVDRLDLLLERADAVMLYEKRSSPTV